MSNRTKSYFVSTVFCRNEYSDVEFCIVELTKEYINKIESRKHKVDNIKEPYFEGFFISSSITFIGNVPDSSEKHPDAVTILRELKKLSSPDNSAWIVTDVDLSTDVLRDLKTLLRMGVVGTKFECSAFDNSVVFKGYEKDSSLEVCTDSIDILDLECAHNDACRDYVVYNGTLTGEKGQPLFWHRTSGNVIEWGSLRGAKKFSLSDKGKIALPTTFSYWLSYEFAKRVCAKK